MLEQKLELETVKSLSTASSSDTALDVVANCVASFHPNPPRNGTILSHLFSILRLDTESLVSQHFENVFSQRRFTGKTTNDFYV